MSIKIDIEDAVKLRDHNQAVADTWNDIIEKNAPPEIKETKKIVDSSERLNPVQQKFPEDLKALLIFEESGDFIIVKPRRFLGSDNFAKIASVVRDLGGEYVSAGKSSHFKIPKA